jgi:hypothetical protein
MIPSFPMNAVHGDFSPNQRNTPQRQTDKCGAEAIMPWSNEDCLAIIALTRCCSWRSPNSASRAPVNKDSDLTGRYSILEAAERAADKLAAQSSFLYHAAVPFTCKRRHP